MYVAVYRGNIVYPPTIIVRIFVTKRYLVCLPSPKGKYVIQIRDRSALLGASMVEHHPICLVGKLYFFLGEI
jgi:hypothetical protein